jgi:hypothetical protein
MHSTVPKWEKDFGLLRSFWDMRHPVAVEQSLPLTLTLSLREREQKASDWRLADDRWANAGTGVIERRWTILRLPRERAGLRGEPSVAQPAVQSAKQDWTAWKWKKTSGLTVQRFNGSTL